MGLERVERSSGVRATREPPATPYGDAIVGLRAVLAQHARADTPEAALRRALQPVLRMARARGVSAAQLILAVREVWASRPLAPEGGEAPAQAGGQLERLVALCVEPYDG